MQNKPQFRQGLGLRIFLCFGEQLPVPILASEYETIFKSNFDANIAFFHIIARG